MLCINKCKNKSVSPKANLELAHRMNFSRKTVESIVQVKKEVEKHVKKGIREITGDMGEGATQGDRQALYIIPNSLSSLIHRTGFSRKEIQRMYRAFKQYCPRGTLTMNTLKPVYAKFFPLGDPSKYSHIVFNAFDKDKNGVIGFEDLMMEIASIINGSIDEKLSWIFGSYDLNGDGYITRCEMMIIIFAIYDMLGERQTSRATIDKHVDSVFQKMDMDKDGVISREEFMTCCKQDKQIHDQLIMFNKF